MRLIDAENLAKFIDYGHLNNPNEKLYSENDIREMIDMMPTVDAVPVIRCKDCKHWKYEDSGTDGTVQGECDLICIFSDGMFFCAGAERKEE